MLTISTSSAALSLVGDAGVEEESVFMDSPFGPRSRIKTLA
jgi:hypothetical protein